ncbi:MAG: hypothetical protein ABIJ46_01105 [bacterium]
MDIMHSKRTVLYLGLSLVVPVAVMFALPAYGQSGRPRFDLPMAMLVSLVMVLLFGYAVDKRRRLMQTVNLELNKLRRIYHISKNLSETDGQRYRGWFTELHGHLYHYLSAFSEIDFSRYEDLNSKFRELSYHVYKVPELRSSKEEVLYDELLRTVAVVAESRQQIKELKDSRMSSYVWGTIVLLWLALAVTVWLSTADAWTARLSAGMILSGFAAVASLLAAIDSMSSEYRGIARRYVDNIGRIELRRREDE